VWHVIGLQRSVREWAMQQGWGGRPVRQEQAQGILVAGLGMLTAHFAYGGAKRGFLNDACSNLDNRFPIEEQKSDMATTTAGGDPGLP
jgi:hypothetical protein